MVNEKGQAAVTDAIYFLMIVSGLSTLLFFFSVNYGGAVDEQLGLEYLSEYAVSAQKTLLYSSITRVPGLTLENSHEVDFLLAAMKEDFADNAQFDDMNVMLVNSVVGLMEPLADSFNYMYYIYVNDMAEFPFFMLYVRKWPSWSNQGGKIEIEKGTSEIYLCDPSSLSKLGDLVTNVGLVYQSTSEMKLAKLKRSGNETGYDTFSSHATLAMWTVTGLPEGDQIGGGSIIDKDHLNCKCFKKLVLKNANCDPNKTDCETEWKDC